MLDPEVLGIELELERFDLSLENRRETANEVVHEAARAMREAGFGIKAATITPEGADDVGSPNRILREEVDGKVIVRTGRRIPGVTPIAGVHHPISVVRMAVEDAYGAEQWREGEPGAPDEVAFRTERITRGTCRAVAEYAFRTADRMGARVYGGPEVDGLADLRGDAQGGDGRRGRAPSRGRLRARAHRRDLRRPDGRRDRRPAGHPGAQPRRRLPVGPRDADVRLDRGRRVGAARVRRRAQTTQVAMAEAPHGTAPALQGKDVANPMAMILACAAVLHYAAEGGHEGAEEASRAIYESVMETSAAGVRTTRPRRPRETTTEFTDEVVRRVRAKIDIWSSLGSTIWTRARARGAARRLAASPPSFGFLEPFSRAVKAAGTPAEMSVRGPP